MTRNFKRIFQLEWADRHDVPNIKISIIGQEPEHKPYVSINAYSNSEPIFIKDKDLERFAINILRALKSKRLKV